EEISDRPARGRCGILAGRKPVPAPALRRGGAGLPRPLHQALQPCQGARGAASAGAVAGRHESEGNVLRHARRGGPQVSESDHGLRAEARREALAVKRLARSLGVEHRTLRWSGRKPSTGLQEAARLERYRLLAGAARAASARHVLTAHTLDDKAETVLIRLI